MDIDRNGVAWVALGSGHLASFDRRKCKGPLNGPKATGQHCPEGWTLYPTPGPNFKNVKDSGSADSHYYDWVDQFDTLGLGKNTPIVTGNSSDSLLALVNGKFVIMRVPYPLGFFAKGMDGRIDDPKAGWKGKGVWTTWGTRTPFHSETGKGTIPEGGPLPDSARSAGGLRISLRSPSVAARQRFLSHDRREWCLSHRAGRGIPARCVRLFFEIGAGNEGPRQIHWVLHDSLHNQPLLAVRFVDQIVVFGHRGLSLYGMPFLRRYPASQVVGHNMQRASVSRRCSRLSLAALPARPPAAICQFATE